MLLLLLSTVLRIFHVKPSPHKETVAMTSSAILLMLLLPVALAVTDDDGYNLFYESNRQEMNDEPITFDPPLPNWLTGTLVRFSFVAWRKKYRLVSRKSTDCMVSSAVSVCSSATLLLVFVLWSFVAVVDVAAVHIHVCERKKERKIAMNTSKTDTV